MQWGKTAYLSSKIKFIHEKASLIWLLFLLPISSKAQFDHQNINLLDSFNDPAVTAEPVYGIRYQSCYGWANPADGKEYGIIGSTFRYIYSWCDWSHSDNSAWLCCRKTYRLHLAWIQSIWSLPVYYKRWCWKQFLQIADLSYRPIQCMWCMMAQAFLHMLTLYTLKEAYCM